ncbi:hypothetical protein ON010_g8775 [Phytophthora cinnamomi]|nr:hypothetical protein ON010_g8775 [Phytophthora cinnamomi]
MRGKFVGTKSIIHPGVAGAQETGLDISEAAREGPGPEVELTSEPALPPPVATAATSTQVEAIAQAPATTPPAKTASPRVARRTPTTKAATPRNTPTGKAKRNPPAPKLKRRTPATKRYASDSEEDKAPAPALHPSMHVCDNVRESVVLTGHHGGEDTAELRARTVLLSNRLRKTMYQTHLLTTDILNVDAGGGRDIGYGALGSVDEAANDDVVTDADSNHDEWLSDVRAMGESEANLEQDAMDIQLAKEFLDEFGGADAVLAGNLMEKQLKAFSATGWGVIHELQRDAKPKGGRIVAAYIPRGIRAPSRALLRRSRAGEPQQLQQVARVHEGKA